MGGWWPYSCCFVGCCFQDLFKITCSILALFSSSFFSMHFVNSHVVHPCSSNDTATACKKSHFSLSVRSVFHTIDELSVAVHAFARCISTSLSVDETLLLRYMLVYIKWWIRSFTVINFWPQLSNENLRNLEKLIPLNYNDFCWFYWIIYVRDIIQELKAMQTVLQANNFYQIKTYITIFVTI